ncbi:MAG: glycerol-3-phosphate acyltransferase [Oscillospiraceae bacterium]|nr:glycerol-3-phosphate acyltransferase [Oscillospiraceae bacterium]
MAYILAILGGYLLGCSNMAYWLAKARGVDLRSGGSGNLGASNAVTMMGWKAGVITALHDGAKAFLAVLLFRWIFPEVEAIGTVAGVAAVYGHIYPFYLKFKGGKGLASYVGLLVALNWKLALALFVVIAIATVVTDYIVVGTVLVVLIAPVYYAVTGDVTTALILAAASLLMIWKHRINYVRIYKGTEVGLRSAARGEHRVK